MDVVCFGGMILYQLAMSCCFEGRSWMVVSFEIQIKKKTREILKMKQDSKT